jgi:hypothetical protein
VKKHAAIVIIIIIIFAIGAAPVTRTTTRATTRKTDADRRAVRAAVAALVKEFAKGEPRPACTYFKDHPSKEITDAAIVEELTAPFSNARQAAYIRCQLLSGLSESPDEQTVTQLLTGYRAAPMPFGRPGISTSEQQKLDQLVRGKTLADEADLKHQIELLFESAAKENQPILAYRDELYRRLPKDLPTFAAVLTDLNIRMAAVADGKELVKQFAKDVHDWAATKNPPPSQLAGVADAVRKLADSKGPYYYGSASWRPSSRSFTWTKTRSGIDNGKALKELADALEEQSRQPPLALEQKTKEK